MTTIEITGMDDIQRRIAQLQDLRPARAALLAAGTHVKGKINKYPPATEANSESQPRWYERGYGPRWRRRDGSIGGRRTSQTLGRRWTVEASSGGMVVTVGNNVTYGPYVQDAEHQARFHAAHGWKTAQQVVDDESATIVRFIEAELDKVLGR